MTRELLQRAKERLREGGYTCVLYSESEQLTSKERGVKPLLRWVEEGRRLQGFCGADKVVGRAAAFLYVKLGIEDLYAEVLSEPAREVLTDYGISVEYGVLTQMIRNRTGEGYCPMEQATLCCSTPEEAERAIRQKLKELTEAK